MEENKIYNVNVYTWSKWCRVKAFLASKNLYLQRNRVWLSDDWLQEIVDFICEVTEPNNYTLDVVILFNEDVDMLVQKLRDALSHNQNIVIHFIG